MSCYILGTGLSHDGSACLLNDGKIIVAIEKERLSRVKHDGGNDSLAVKYCLDAAGIKAADLTLIVQAANFEIDIAKDRYNGSRHFTEDLQVPVVTLSHHLAHAWSAAAASPFSECNVMVLDGAGSPYKHCLDLDGAFIPTQNFDTGMFCEKDSFYHFDGSTLTPLYKDFSEVRLFEESSRLKLPTNYHSIGGLYSAASFYCFRNMDDAGKLMGLAPYGNLDNKPALFNLDNGRVEVNYESVNSWFTNPAIDYQYFKNKFAHYADIARWVQDETEKAVSYLFTERQRAYPHPNVAYAGGVALNAVANKKLMQLPGIKQLYMQPAAGDNGLAIGCAWYGWHTVLDNGKQPVCDSPFMGRRYVDAEIRLAIKQVEQTDNVVLKVIETQDPVTETAALLADGKIVGWFQGGAEFGPRALGHRSILADPRSAEVRDHINREIKFREDFRPFAPAVRKEDVHQYFEHGWDSPYMILVDNINPEWRDLIPAVVHRDGTCRVQTVTADWNARFYNLIGAFKDLTGVGVLLNTSLNKKGMPIVETPLQAIELFFSGAMDVLVIENFIIYKNKP